MKFKIILSDEFSTAFKKLKKRHRSLVTDFAKLIESLENGASTGVNLFDDVFKVRMSISSKNQGKSGGARVIVRIQIINDTLKFIYIYDKSDMQNVNDDYLKFIINNMDE